MGSRISPSQIQQNLYDEETNSMRISPSAGQLITEAFDYIGATFPDGVTEVYTYKSGGSGGTTVATVTVVYTSSAKSSVSSVTKA